MHAEFSRGLTALSYALDYDQNIYVYITLFTQVYIVSGGIGVILEGGWRSKAINLASTETLEKEGGSAWQLVASLPSARFKFRGLGLDNGRFMVSGQLSIQYHTCNILNILIIFTLDAWQVES